MREYGQIQTAFWASPEIQSVSDQAKLLAAYLLTGPHSNGLGCYRLPDGYVMADFGWTQERVSKAFSELFQIGFCKRCEQSNFVLIPKFMKWNGISNPKVAKARQAEFNAIPKNSSIHAELCASLLTYGKHFDNPFETLLKGYAKQEPTLSEPERNQRGTESCAESPSDSTPQHEESETLITIPLNDGSEYPITDLQVSEWQELFPAVNVMQSLRNMRAWSNSNRPKRKTRNGVLKFITGWLTKDQDKGGAGGAQQRRGRLSRYVALLRPVRSLPDGRVLWSRRRPPG